MAVAPFREAPELSRLARVPVHQGGGSARRPTSRLRRGQCRRARQCTPHFRGVQQQRHVSSRAGGESAVVQSWSFNVETALIWRAVDWGQAQPTPPFAKLLVRCGSLHLTGVVVWCRPRQLVPLATRADELTPGLALGSAEVFEFLGGHHAPSDMSSSSSSSQAL